MFVTALYILLAVLYGIVFVFIVYTIYAFIKGAPFLPTSRQHVKEMIELAQPQKGELLIDLGSGDGRILYEAAKSGCNCLGIEINPLLYWWSRLITKLKKLSNIHIRREDLWQTDLRLANILTLFFIAPKMDKLHAKIQREMRPGSRVVSYGFKFPNWQPIEKRDKIYLYKVQ